jgi:hypothetical protein
MAQLHLVSSTIPTIEIAYDGDRARIGCPNSKIHPCNTMYYTLMRSHLFVDAMVFPLPKQIQVEIAKDGRNSLFFRG